MRTIALLALALLAFVACAQAPSPERSPLEAMADEWFTTISAGYEHTCGVRADGSVACWGRAEGGQALPPEGKFAYVSGGYRHTCGVRADSSVACWGWNQDGQTTPPEGEFASVNAGVSHTCGVRGRQLRRLLGPR